MIFIYFRAGVSQPLSLHRRQVLFPEDTSCMEFLLLEEEIKCGLKVTGGNVRRSSQSWLIKADDAVR